MATLALPNPNAAHRTLPATLRLFLKETRYEFLMLLRNRIFSLSVVGFPLMFYSLFGLTSHGQTSGGADVAKYMLAGYCCFGMIGAALFGIGVGLASERAQGWLELKRASPMPPMAYLLAKCITAQAFGILIIAVLTTAGIAFGGVHLRPTEFFMMLALSIAGMIPFAALGLLVALIAPPNAAAGVVNLIYLPMSFLSGLWIPLRMLPHWMQTIAPIFPTYHLSQLMLSIFGYQNQSTLTSHWLGLAGFTCLILGACWAVFHRAEQDA